MTALAATPRAVAGGKVWLLLTSALIADRPALASLLGLGIVGSAALVLLGGRLAVIVAAAGHVLSAAAVYLGIAVARLLDPSALASVLSEPDYGLSAIVAAWLGAAAAREWRRRPLVVAGICVASAAIGWLLRGTLTVLDSEHLVAFAIGAAAVKLPLRLPQAVRNRPPALPQSAEGRLR